MTSFPTFSFGAGAPAGGGGGGQAGVGARGSFIIGEELVISPPVASDGGTFEIPAWLQIVNDTVGMTAQQSATTVQSGYAIHTPRAYSQDGVTRGLLVEPASVNLASEQDFTAWTPTGTPIINTVAGPDASTGPYEVEDDDAASVESVAFAITPGAVALPHTLSAWHFLTAPAPTTSSTLTYLDGVSDPQISLAAVDADWAFASSTVATIGSGSFVVVPRVTNVADVGATRWFGVSLEQRSYPTSFHAGTRSADILRAAHASVVAHGFFTVSMSYRPHYSDTQTTVDHNLLYVNSSNRLFFRQTDRTFVLRVDGEDLTVGPVTFSAHDTITIAVEHTERRRKITVSGATTGDGTSQGDPLRAARVESWVHILGGPGGAEEASDLLTFDQNATTFCDLALARLLVQMDRTPGTRDFYEKLCALLKEQARIYDVGFTITSSFDVDSAIGDQQDIIGSIVGLSREGFSDSKYRTYLQIQIGQLLSGVRDDGQWTGTIENILSTARVFIGAGTPGIILYEGIPPYAFKLSLPVVLPIAEIKLLARFLSLSVYAGVLGFFEFPLSTDVWGSASVAVPNVGTWGSASVVVAGTSIWDLVITT